MQELQLEKGMRGRPVGFIGISQAGWIVPVAALQSRGTCFMVMWSGAVETTHEDLHFEQLTQQAADFWDHHTQEEVRSQLAATADSFEWPDFDPRAALSQLTIPGLWLYGGRDVNVDVDLSVERLKGLIDGGHSNYRYRVFPAFDHQLGNFSFDVIDPTLQSIRDSVASGCR